MLRQPYLTVHIAGCVLIVGSDEAVVMVTGRKYTLQEIHFSLTNTHRDCPNVVCRGGVGVGEGGKEGEFCRGGVGVGEGGREGRRESFV